MHPEELVPSAATLRAIATAIIILTAGGLASKWAYRLAVTALTKTHLDQALARFLASMLRYTVLAATFIASMETVGIHTTSLVAVVASAGLAVGLALQGSLSNFASGVLILFFKHFQLGDKVAIGSHKGIVEDIGLFNTTLVSTDNEKIVIPNAAVTNGPIVNYSDRGLLRGAVTLTVEGRLRDLEPAMEALVRAGKRASGVARDPAPTVFLTDMEDGSLDLTLTAWYSAVEEDGSMHNLRVAALEELDAAGVKLMNRTQLVLHQRSKGPS
ncbi:mechanosensitive ion channel family protein [Sorangium sp. So ce363]|uniref:mechanosensitive ion channel family protein n=1 Tax=Sorangium sp. So ce363 TaxID=3133304 RepID=UPI003F5DEA51